MSTIESIAELAPTFTGQLLQPADGAYDDARRVHNGLVDKRPALIARCLGTADVADAVKLARTQLGGLCVAACKLIILNDLIW